MKKYILFNVVIAVFLIMVPFSLFSQDAEKPSVSLKNIRGPIFQVENVSGGNIVVYLGKENILMVDSGTDPGDAPKVETALSEFTDKPVETVVITHWHSDHVGGNVFWAGKGATIIGHENLNARLSTKVMMDFFGTESEPLAEAGRPTVTFTDEKIIDVDDSRVRLFHIRPGHTDGDCIIHFMKENVIHVGDLFFNTLYPYIGVSSGGSIGGMITVLTEVTELIDDETIVVPGHGPLSDKAGMKAYVEMLSTIQKRVAKLLKEGKTLEEIQAARPTEEFDEDWGILWMDGNEFTRLVVMSLSGS
ncbi:MAG: MBL fold metallo-hydrolase [Bacteroidales bacterium]|nr:MBL fold metallo-hydrolase [Candidatus Latescibacterota bacterium]